MAEDDRPEKVREAMDEEFEPQSDMVAARSPTGFLPPFDESNPPVQTADIPDFAPSQQPEPTGPSIEDRVRQKAWERRTARRDRMGMGATEAPRQIESGESGFAEQQSAPPGFGGGGNDMSQTFRDMQESLNKMVELLESIEEKIENLGELA